MGIDYILDTSNQHPKVRLEDQKEEFLVRFELTVRNNQGNMSSTSGGTDVITFNVYGLTWAKDSADAFKNMKEMEDAGINFKLEIGEVIGAVKDESRRKIHDSLHELGQGYVLP